MIVNDNNKMIIKEDNKRNKEKCDNLDDNEKKSFEKIQKNLGEDEKEQVRKNDKKRKMDKRLQNLGESSISNNVQMCSLTGPGILTTPAF